MQRIQFRRHIFGGTLDETFETLIEVDATIDALVAAIQLILWDWPTLFAAVTRETVSVEPYAFDERIGWYTHIVTIEGRAFGWTDGPVSR